MQYPTTAEELAAVKPLTIRFTIDLLEVECPRCRKWWVFRLPAQQPKRDDYCPGCLAPWRWT